MNRSQRSGLLLILVSAAGYSFFAIFTKLIYDNSTFAPLDVVIWRFLIAAPITWLWMGWTRRGQGETRRQRLPRKRLLGLGMLFGVVATVAFFAVERLPVSLYTVLIYTYPTLVAVGAIAFGERLSQQGWLALGLTIIGAVLTVPNLFQGLAGVDGLGVIFVLTNAVTYALYILLSNRTLRGASDLSGASAWSISGSFLLVILLIGARAAAGEATPLPPNPTVWASFIGLAVISTVIPIFTFYAGMHRLGAPRAAIISMLEPVLTLVWAVVLRHEHLQLIQVVGAALILMSVVVLQARREHRLAERVMDDAPSAVR